MARVTAPLFGLQASGSIAQALTYARWKGINYVRTRVVPANPQTTAQTAIRNIFRTLSAMWIRMPQGARNPFLYDVRGVPMTDRNRHVQANVPALQGEGDLNNLVMSVANGQAVPFDNVVAADGADGTVTVTADSPTAPTGYTLETCIGLAVLDGDPEDFVTRTTYLAYDGSTPWSLAIDVPADGTYQVGVWAEWIRDSDGRFFSSLATRSQVVVTGN